MSPHLDNGLYNLHHVKEIRILGEREDPLTQELLF